jgi:hypothetical protein
MDNNLKNNKKIRLSRVKKHKGNISSLRNWQNNCIKNKVSQI